MGIASCATCSMMCLLSLFDCGGAFVQQHTATCAPCHGDKQEQEHKYEIVLQPYLRRCRHGLRGHSESHATLVVVVFAQWNPARQRLRHSPRRTEEHRITRHLAQRVAAVEARGVLVIRSRASWTISSARDLAGGVRAVVANGAQGISNESSCP